MIDTSNSIFWKEIFEQPEAVANCLAANREVCKQIAAEVKERNIKTVGAGWPRLQRPCKPGGTVSV